MSIVPLITFKAGMCDVDQSTRPYKVTAQPRPGYIYLYSEDDLVHFCWRPRNVPMQQPELDLVMVPTDGHFVPYDAKSISQPSAKTNGRIFVLKFSSSSQRYLFWLQSKPQGQSGSASWFSPRDLKIGDIVDRFLQGEEVEVGRELAQVRNNNDDSRRDEDDDETMEDVEGHGDPNEQHEGGLGGAGAGATGGDVREEGEEAREGGADGARAAAGATDAAAMVRNLLEALKGAPGLASSQPAEGKLYPLLSDLLDSATTIAMVEQATESSVDNLMGLLPPAVVVLSQRAEDENSEIGSDPTPEAAAAARAAMSLGQKRTLLKTVLRSPQFHQSLVSLTLALRDGGLPSVSEALGIKVQNGGRLEGSAVPLGGGEAVEAFVEGVKRSVQEKQE